MGYSPSRGCGEQLLEGAHDRGLDLIVSESGAKVSMPCTEGTIDVPVRIGTRNFADGARAQPTGPARLVRSGKRSPRPHISRARGRVARSWR